LEYTFPFLLIHTKCVLLIHVSPYSYLYLLCNDRWGICQHYVETECIGVVVSGPVLYSGSPSVISQPFTVAMSQATY